MKRFVKYILLFIAPIIVYLVVLEILVGHIPNSYTYKYNYVKNNGQNVDVLACGNSHLYDGFMPEVFDLRAFNLSNSGQSFVDNYYILEELLPYLPNLKVAFMPIGYLNVKNVGVDSSLSDRCCYYHKYMHLNYDGQVPLKYLFECFDPYKASKKVFMYYVLHSDIVGCDSLGRRSTHYLKDRKHALGHDKLLEGYTIEQHDDLCIKSEYYLIKSIELLKRNGVKVVQVSPPYYWEGFDNVNFDQREFLKKRVSELCDRYRIDYVDMEMDSTYTDQDFFNETHLSEMGAERFSKTLNKYIMESVNSSSFSD